MNYHPDFENWYATHGNGQNKDLAYSQWANYNPYASQTFDQNLPSAQNNPAPFSTTPATPTATQNPLFGSPIPPQGYTGLPNYNQPFPNTTIPPPITPDAPLAPLDAAGDALGGVAGAGAGAVAGKVASTALQKGMAWGTAGIGVAELGIGLYSAYQHRNDQLPKYTVDPFIQSAQAEENAARGQGFTESERKAYEGKVYADQLNTAMNAVNMSGGNLSSAVIAATAGNANRTRNDLAISDAQLKMQKMSMSDQINNVVQGQNNLQTQQLTQKYYAQKQASNQAIAAGLGNLGKAANLAFLL